MHVLLRKYRVRNYTLTDNEISGHSECLSAPLAYQTTKRLKLRPYRFHSVHQLQEFNVGFGLVVLCAKGFLFGS
jgi:hypothetical protein